jgi:WS/DGAT/MGAT family acyltransferase
VREAASGAVRGRPTLNDVCLAVAAGALRAHAAERELPSPPLKAMVPVSVRGDGERGRMGNRISFAFVDLPLDVAEPADRLEAVRRQTAAFKESGRPRGFGLLLDALATLPGPARGRAARLAASPRSYNLVVSNVPGPREPLYMLGAQLLEAYPVVPLSEDHALSIGIFSYRDHAFFGLYADPVALAGVDRMPALLGDSLAELRDAVRREGPEPARRSGLRPPERRAAGAPALAEVAP